MGRLIRFINSLKFFRKRQKMPHLNSEGKFSKRGLRFLYLAPKFATYFMRNKKVLRAVYRVISNDVELEKLRLGVPFEGHDFRISNETTGSFKGIWHIAALKVSFARKNFFVKIMWGRKAEDALKGMRIVEDFLKRKKHSINNFNVHVIPAIMLYDEAVSFKSYLVSRFYKEGEVRQVCDLSGKLRRDIDDTLNIVNFSRERLGIDDIDSHNAFYFPKDNSIGLFDIRYSRE